MALCTRAIGRAPALLALLALLALSLIVLVSAEPIARQPLLTPLLASVPLDTPLPLAMLNLSLAHLRNLVPALVLRLRGPPLRRLDARVVVGAHTVTVAVDGEVVGAGVIDGGWGLEVVVGDERRRVVLPKRVVGEVGVVVGEGGVRLRVARDGRIWWGWLALMAIVGGAVWALRVGAQKGVAVEEDEEEEEEMAMV